MLLRRYFLSTLILLISGCSIFLPPPPEPITITPQSHQVNFLTEVKPILDKRCVACHSCYNAACQAKFSSYEGLDRGATKIKVYDALRFKAIEPTRLFKDAKNTQEWHEKGFFSLIKNEQNTPSQNNDILSHLLNHKLNNPEVKGSYDPEHESLMCPKDNQELAQYFKKKPNHGMPYGLPALEKQEVDTLLQWISQGANGPSDEEQKALTSPSHAVSEKIQQWENFFNQADPKHTVSARYLYEHLYLAHLSFDISPNEFYSLVRSRTPAPEAIDEIVTTRPFDDPQVDRVYYRFKKIHSTIVHKTHMVVSINDEKLTRLKKQFIESEWDEEPHFIPYNAETSANPFVVFAQIPTRARYQFLLDNSHYTIMTFIRGPVCRGQMALNVIHDHFWVMFQDPDYDISVQQPQFLLDQAENLTTPIADINKSVFSTFSNQYINKYNDYAEAKFAKYREVHPEGFNYDAIWKGERAEDAPMLTIYRHFNSASVHKGVLGGMPRTLWVIDYPQLERIYYSLVAGYDVFGNVSHQTNIRRYMDFLRIEGEANFLSYMPHDIRLEMFKSWYIGNRTVQNINDERTNNFGPTGIQYQSDNPKYEFVETLVNQHLLPATNIAFDEINYFSASEPLPEMPAAITNLNELQQALKSLSLPGTGFLTYIHDSSVNTIFIKVTEDDGTEHHMTMVVNRWHDNVYSMFNEASTLDSTKDTIDFIKQSVGSYANVFVDLKASEVPDFLEMIKNFDNSEEDIERARKYFISRANPEFWDIYDWFQNTFNKDEPITSGLYDLNRYLKDTW